MSQRSNKPPTMSWQGGKTRLRRFIAPLIQEELGEDSLYFEPFCGFCSIAEAVCAGQKLVCDANADWIALLQAVTSGKWSAEKLWSLQARSSKEEWAYWRSTGQPHPMRGFYGGTQTFSGWWFRAYVAPTAHKSNTANNVRRLIRLASANLTVLPAADYDAWRPQGAVVYADPPYEGTKSYDGAPEFDHARFWDVMDRWATSGNRVFVSEAITAPPVPGWRCIWEKDVQIHRHARPRTERLFVKGRAARGSAGPRVDLMRPELLSQRVFVQTGALAGASADT